jgi:hypothetical protein
MIPCFNCQNTRSPNDPFCRACRGKGVLTITTKIQECFNCKFANAWKNPFCLACRGNGYFEVTNPRIQKCFNCSCSNTWNNPHCVACRGNGYFEVKDPNGIQKCFNCSLSNTWNNPHCVACRGNGFISANLSPCPSCSVANKWNNPFCRGCNGKGHVTGSISSAAPSVFAISSPSSAQFDCFLSHDWSADELGRNNHLRARNLKLQLESRGLRVWFDESQMSSNILDSMTNGIDNSRVFLVFVTQAYLNKVNGSETRDNCKLEFNYAYQRKSPSKMLPIVMESRMLNTRSWQGIVGAALGSTLYDDFSDDSKISTVCDSLVEKINRL